MGICVISVKSQRDTPVSNNGKFLILRKTEFGNSIRGFIDKT